MFLPSDGVVVKMFEYKKVLSSVTYSVPCFIASCCLWSVVCIIHCGLLCILILLIS